MPLPPLLHLLESEISKSESFAEFPERLRRSQISTVCAIAGHAPVDVRRRATVKTTGIRQAAQSSVAVVPYPDIPTNGDSAMTMPLATHQFSDSTVADDREQLAANVAKMVEALQPAYLQDKALELGQRLAAARQRHIELDEKKSELPDRKHVASSIFDDAMNHEYDREWALRQYLSFERAESSAGAAIQISECLVALDSIWDQFPRESETFDVKQDHRRLNRLLFSVLRFLKQEAADELGECIEDSFRDPWLSAEEATAQHEMLLEKHELKRQARIARKSNAR